ncbi:MAG: cupin [Deltaproteobacteria bacterium RIFCSPLOWO2_02_FULL_46_8]|nr:MAG: cupin [Deltaproteobacteria bacterium RIFCSPLOWO2_02_FULL_46_8]
MTNNVTVKELVTIFDLKPHPEGGFFKETFRDSEFIPQKALPSRFKSDRNFSTAIYFLLPEGTKSRLHRIASDEVWHFYLGDSLTIVQISPKGEVEKIVLGQDVKTGQKVQHVVPEGYWFGAYPNSGSRYSFVGCTVAPGFDFADFEMGKRSDLLKQFPKAKEVIELLTD